MQKLEQSTTQFLYCNAAFNRKRRHIRMPKFSDDMLYRYIDVIIMPIPSSRPERPLTPYKNQEAERLQFF